MKNVGREFVLLPRSIVLGLLFVAGIFSIVASNGPSPGPSPTTPVIAAIDTYMFSYIDRQGRVRVRWSQDGWRWEDGDINTAPAHDSGVGSASNVDGVGLTRWVAYPSFSGRLVLHAALGATFDPSGNEFSAVRTRGAPTMTAISGSNWVVATLGGNLNQAAVFNVFDGRNTLTDITPANPVPILNDQLQRPPQIMSRGGTFVAAWMRWQTVGPTRVPIDIRVLRGTDASGTIVWQGSSLFGNSEPGFTGPLTDPALTHDGSEFLLGVVRQETASNDEFLFIYRSSDAVSWTLSDRLEISFDAGTTVRMAAHGLEKMMIGVNRTSSAGFYRKWKGEWESVRGANVFGTQRPDWFRFSLIAAGRPRSDIFVDSQATAPGNGSQASPYQSIQEATDRAKRGDRILLANTSYQENVSLPAGVTLAAETGQPQITTTGFDPSVVAEGDNYIKGISIFNNVDFSTGILVNLDTALDGLEGSGSAAYLDVEDTQIRTQNFGVLIESDPGLAFGGDNQRVFRPRLKHNKMTGHTTGIKLEINGPSTGMLQIPIEAYDNILENNGTGIWLNIIGGAPNTGGFARATITGRIRNNLIFNGSTGVVFDAENGGTILTPLYFNTIAENNQHNVICHANAGPNGQSRVRSRLSCNIVAGAAQFGFIEFTDRCNLAGFENNVFFGNRDHYDDFPVTTLNSEAQLNSPTIGGTGNRIADPLFEPGDVYWAGSITTFAPAGEFFLTQSGATVSPAVDHCSGAFTVEDNELGGQSTRTDYIADVDPPDAGFHYIQ